MQPFETYEQVATFLLNEFASRFGLIAVEGKQIVAGQATRWEIDAKGVKADSDRFIVVECRRYTSTKLDQEALAGLAYRIHDVGADGGIVVTPIGLQEGAQRVAQTEGIVTVRLDSASTTTDYVMEFLKHVMVGRSLDMSATADMSCCAEVVRQCRACGEQFVVAGDERLCLACATEPIRRRNGG